MVRVGFLEEMNSVVWIHTLEYQMERIFQVGTKNNRVEREKAGWNSRILSGTKS